MQLTPKYIIKLELIVLKYQISSMSDTLTKREERSYTLTKKEERSYTLTKKEERSYTLTKKEERSYTLTKKEERSYIVASLKLLRHRLDKDYGFYNFLCAFCKKTRCNFHSLLLQYMIFKSSFIDHIVQTLRSVLPFKKKVSLLISSLIFIVYPYSLNSKTFKEILVTVFARIYMTKYPTTLSESEVKTRNRKKVLRYVKKNEERLRNYFCTSRLIKYTYKKKITKY